ncbi:hypothetical protein WJX81_007954 [Elliptochloris bilobata]|uniref:Misato Segment II tubulin-like domain-containing protein n=1 Tax=Elliptochloris bilobata TaxID=381761 RepID=A0AAW1QZ53_9CHLO
MGRGEVITLQFGGFANFVGAHYWNIQDELAGLAERQDYRGIADQVDPTVLFRQGENAQGQATYSPRLVLFDHASSIGGVSTHDAAPSAAALMAAGAAGVATWQGPVAVHQAEPVPRSRFAQELDAEPDTSGGAGDGQADLAAAALHAAVRHLDAGPVRSWTDYLKVVLHPRSLVALGGLWGSEGAAFAAGFGPRAAAAAPAGALDDWLDRVRRFAEECDALQGFQALSADQGGFGGLTTDVMGALRDEYPRAPTLLFAVRPSADGPADADGQRRWRLSEALSAAELAPRVSLYAPLAPPPSPQSLPHLRWRLGDAFHTSAMLAAVVDTVTLPYRLDPDAPPRPLGAPLGACDLHSLAQLLAGRAGHSIVGVAAALPAPSLPDAHAAAAAADARANGIPAANGFAPNRGAVEACEPPFTQRCTAGWSPGIAAGGGLEAETVVLRGARRSGDPVSTSQAAAALDASLVREGVRCVRHRCVAAAALPIPLPFPQLFAPTVLRHGDVLCAGGSQGLGSAPQGLGQGPGQGAGPPAAGGAEVEAVPVLSRMFATAGAAEFARRQLQIFRGTAATAQGRAVLAGWGCGPEEAADVEEQLLALALAWEVDDEFY